MDKDRWRRGKTFDLWSIPHFLFGMLAAFLPPLTGISFLTAFALTIMFAMLWEIYEKFVAITETTQNILLDLILPVVAFIFTSLALRLFSFTYEEILVAAIAISILYLFTNISGWLAYRRRNRDFTH